MTGIIKAFGIERTGERGAAKWSAIVAGAPSDTRAGHDHLWTAVRRAIHQRAAKAILDAAYESGRILYKDGGRVTFDRAVEFDLAPYWKDEPAVVENRPFNEGDLY